MKSRNISSRRDAVTKDVPEPKAAPQLYNFPTLGVSVEASTMDEALTKAKEVIKANK